MANIWKVWFSSTCQQVVDFIIMIYWGQHEKMYSKFSYIQDLQDIQQCIKYKRRQLSKRGLRHWDQLIHYTSDIQSLSHEIKVFRGSSVLSGRHQSSVQHYFYMKLLNYYNARMWAGDGSMITDFCCDRRRIFTKYLCSYLKQIVCCTLRHSTSLASSYEGSWNVHNSMLIKSYTNMRTPTNVSTSHLFLNRHSHISISYLYVPNLQYFATWIQFPPLQLPTTEI
jgi:hypothetical protein